MWLFEAKCGCRSTHLTYPTLREGPLPLPPLRGRRGSVDWAGFIDMRGTCIHPFHVPKTIQIRNVPDELRCKLELRAARAGLSLSAYMLRQICEVAERPTLDEMRARLKSRSVVKPSISPVRAVRAVRGR